MAVFQQLEVLFQQKRHPLFPSSTAPLLCNYPARVRNRRKNRSAPARSLADINHPRYLYRVPRTIRRRRRKTPQRQIGTLICTAPIDTHFVPCYNIVVYIITSIFAVSSGNTLRPQSSFLRSFLFISMPRMTFDTASFMQRFLQLLLSDNRKIQQWSAFHSGPIPVICSKKSKSLLRLLFFYPMLSKTIATVPNIIAFVRGASRRQCNLLLESPLARLLLLWQAREL